MIKYSWIEQGSGQRVEAVYQNADDFSNLPYEQVGQVICFAFEGEKMIVVLDGDKKSWGPPGGSLEKEQRESYRECAERELQEEANMKVLKYQPIGYQKVELPNGKFEYQLRVFCQVEPYGEFIADPDGDVVEIKKIDPAEMKKYFDWKEVGGEILNRALEFLNKNKNIV